MMKKENKKEEEKNYPRVKIESITLRTQIGKWLGIIRNWEEKERKSLLPTKKAKVEEEFGKLLSLLGVPKEENCTLRNYDEKTNSFLCIFEKAQEIEEMSLFEGDGFDYCSQITISSQNERKKYDYIMPFSDSPMRVKLEEFTHKNPENQNEYRRFFSTFVSCYSVKNKDYKLSMNIARPKELNQDEKKNHTSYQTKKS